MAAGTLQLTTISPLPGSTAVTNINSISANLAVLNANASAPTTGITGLSSTSGLMWHNLFSGSKGIINIRDQADANWLPMFYIDETNKLIGRAGEAGTWVTVGGTGNAITLTYSVAPPAYVQGMKLAFKATAANTSTTTVNVNSLGVKNIFKKLSGSAAAACAGSEIQSGDLVEIEYDGTQFQIVGSSSNKQMTFTILTSGSGTYTTPPGCTRLEVDGVGGGGGGAAANTNSGGSGGTTSFGAITALGGAAGVATGGSVAGGGGASGGDINLSGGGGQSGANSANVTLGGQGGASFFGGNGPGGGASQAGGNAAANTGGGGGGGGSSGTSSGGGGGAGGYFWKLIINPVATYAYAVGAAGTAGAAGGTAGGLGAAGIIRIKEYYD